MHLARIRRDPTSAPEPVVRVPDSVDTADRELLLPLLPLLRDASADPVAIAMSGSREKIEQQLRALFSGSSWRAQSFTADSVLFEIPTPTCTKVCCLALNYRAHADESNLSVPEHPVLFFKPTSALVGHGSDVRVPTRTRHLEHEVELAVVIGRRTRDLPAARWRDAVAGYTVINDLTARDLQLINHERNVPWDQAKGFDTFAPIGPYLATTDEVDDPHALRMTLSVDGEVRQSASTSQMVFDIPRLIADLSDGMTLLPGDVIATGTTAGIAPVVDGDVMVASIDSVGTLVNPVRFDKSDADRRGDQETSVSADR